MGYLDILRDYIEKNEKEIFSYITNDYKSSGSKVYFSAEYHFIIDFCKIKPKMKITLKELKDLIKRYEKGKLYYVSYEYDFKAFSYDKTLLEIRIDKLISIIISALNEFSKDELIEFFKGRNLFNFLTFLFKYGKSFSIAFLGYNECDIDLNFLSKLNNNDVLKIINDYIYYCGKKDVKLDDIFIYSFLESTGAKITDEYVEKWLKYIKDKRSLFKKNIFSIILSNVYDNVEKQLEIVLNNIDEIDGKVLAGFLKIIKNNKKLLEKFILNLNKEGLERIVKYLNSLTAEPFLENIIKSTLPDKQNIYLILKKMIDENIDEYEISAFVELLPEYGNFNKLEMEDIVIFLDKKRKCIAVKNIINEFDIDKDKLFDKHPFLNCIEFDRGIFDVFEF